MVYHYSPTCLWRWNRQSVPKRRHIKWYTIIHLLAYEGGTCRVFETSAYKMVYHYSPTCLWIWNRQSVPKRRHIKRYTIIHLLAYEGGTCRVFETSAYKMVYHYSPTCLWRWNMQSVSKRRHIKFRRRGITQKKTFRTRRKFVIKNNKIFLCLTENKCIYCCLSMSL